MIIKHTSDLHLEFGSYPDFSKEEGGDVLILNGDILVAPYLSSIRNDKDATRCRKYIMEKMVPDLINKFPYVLYLCGNHEHYRGDVNTSLNNIKNYFTNLGVENMVFMENDYLDISGVRFIGATLWSDFLNGDPNSMWESRRGMNDFRIISNGRQTFVPEDALQLHNASVAYIENMSDVDMPVVVATHHTPTSQFLNPFHSGNLVDGAYYTDLSSVMEKRKNIKVWISGHTHFIGHTRIHETDCYSNCRGYPGEPVFRQWTGLNRIDL